MKNYSVPFLFGIIFGGVVTVISFIQHLVFDQVSQHQQFIFGGSFLWISWLIISIPTYITFMFFDWIASILYLPSPLYVSYGQDILSFQPLDPSIIEGPTLIGSIASVFIWFIIGFVLSWLYGKIKNRKHAQL